MHLCVSYIRFSSERQKHGTSRDRQLALTKAYCARKGLTLDTSHSYEDLGVSAFRAKNAGVTRSLGRFLEAVESGRVPRGTTLIIESLDRLSRADIWTAMDLLGRILKAGITVVTLEPEREYTREATDGNNFAIVEMILTFIRANEESSTKSARLTHMWSKKKKEAAEHLKPYGKQRPFWIDFVGGKYVLNEERAKLVRRIVQMKADGYGYYRIAKVLNGEGIPARYSDKWSNSSLQLIFQNRNILGDLQQTRLVDGKQVPVGEPIRGYYPAAVTDEALFLRACEVGRKGKRGRVDYDSQDSALNIFTGLVINAADWQVMHAITTNRAKPSGGKYSQKYLVSEGRYTGTPGTDGATIKYLGFERGFLRFFSELRPSDFAPRSEPDPVHDRLGEVSGRIAVVDAKVHRFGARLKTCEESEEAELHQVVAELASEKADLVAEMERLKVQASSNQVERAGEVRHLYALLEQCKTTPEKNVLRQRIKVRLAELVKYIFVFHGGASAERGRGKRLKYKLMVMVLFNPPFKGFRIFMIDQEGEILAQNALFEEVGKETEQGVQDAIKNLEEGWAAKFAPYDPAMTLQRAFRLGEQSAKVDRFDWFRGEKT